MATTNQQTHELDTITADELRKILFHIAYQEMTVKELREKLFHSPNSGEEVKIGFAMFHKMGVQ